MDEMSPGVEGKEVCAHALVRDRDRGIGRRTRVTVSKLVVSIASSATDQQ